MDDRRMELARTELCEHLNDDVIGIIVAYARYTEIEKLRIVLWKEPTDTGYVKDCLTLKTFSSYELVKHIEDDLERDYSIALFEVYNWMFRPGSFIPCKDDEFSIALSGFDYSLSENALVTIEDLLPSKNLDVFVPYVDAALSEHFELIRLEYVSSIQKEMDDL